MKVDDVVYAIVQHYYASQLGITGACVPRSSPECLKQLRAACSLTLDFSCPQMKAGDKCYLFDILQANSGVMQQLQAILEDGNVVKVMQDCKNDSAALMYQTGIEVCNIFDLQVTSPLACNLLCTQ